MSAQRTRIGGKAPSSRDAKGGARPSLSTTHVAEMVEEACASSKSRISLVGQVLSDRYRIERRLGEGAMGQVYLAEHVLMRKRVAVKVLHARMGHKPDAVARFEREAVAASHVEHPNITTAKDFGQLADGSFFLVLEYLDGIVLRSAINQYGALPAKRALHIAAQICSGLVRAHELGIVHRDLKPENVMLIARGDDPDFVKILDFGIARVPMETLASQRDQEEPLTRVGMVQGTPAYMAPEQAMGQELDARADLYALGVLLYEMLTGTRPFAAPTDLLLLTMHVTSAVPAMNVRAPDVNVDPRIEAFVRSLLEKDPAKRPADAYAAEAALLDLAATCGFGPQRAPSYRPAGRASFRGKLDLGTMASGELPAHAASVGLEAANTPPARRPKVRILLAVATPLLLLLLLPLLAFFGARKAPQDKPTMTQAAVTAPVETAQIAELPMLARSTADALAHFEHCEVAAGRSILDRMQSKFDTPAIQQAIASGCFAKGRGREALAALSSLAKENPELALTPAFLADVERAASVPATIDASYTFMEENPTPAVADILYRLTLPPNVRASIVRAEKSLQVPAVRAQASRALAVALSLREAGQGCEAVPFFAEAEKVGDGRALAYLELLEQLHSVTYRKVPGKKAPVGTDSYACLHKGGSLTKAIVAIKARLAR